ncbi:MAG: IS66 family transposase zinc-finger binding domain-containing protein [Spirochaetaceae bacterium]|nr:IS66 family transposase zinc-finger binding domain-containing protein [Spirochaetaceae bacterium]
MSVVETPILPETIEELKTYAIQQYNELSQKKEKINTLTEKYDNLNIKHNDLNIKYDKKAQAYDEKVQDYLEVYEKFKILQSAFFGRSSEKWNVDDKLQASLFNEAELSVDEEGIKQVADSDTITYAVTKKRRGKRQPIPENIPREEIILDIPDEEKICECGCSLVQIGEEVSEKLDIIPAQVKVIRYVRPKWACSHCEGSGDENHPAVRIAPPA